jgi:hypothetical protein
MRDGDGCVEYLTKPRSCTATDHPPAPGKDRGSLKGGCVACAAADDLGFGLGEVDHRGRLGAAVTRVDHGVHGVLELLGDLPALGHGLVLAGQQQGARDQGLAEFGQQRLGHHVLWDPHADGLLPGVLQDPRRLLGRGQDEGVTARSRRLDRPEHRIGNEYELAQLGEILAQQGEVVPVAEAADRPDPGHPVPVAELAPERVAGIRRVRDHAAVPHDVGDLDDRAPLRVVRMDVEVPGHATSLGVSPAP